ncbi:CD48 antigen [Dissostichus eleginoides]|uniref:CD48 antigen n=1 Tax=Dissostichus eleginoides TaxID=100907 RepID=A0AAD9BE67_DISEL|nr:CD48 antigen [Dissostichus eleginoides]
MKSFVTILFVVYELYLCEPQGISAGTVFVLKGEDVLLNNLQEADSGVYTAKVTKLSGDETAAKYNVKVQDRASPPLLTVSSVSDSSSSCSFTVTCSSQDSHINSTFTCETRACSQEGGERSEGIPDTFLQVQQSSGSIICNHSNHVSWTNNTIIIKDVCHQLVGKRVIIGNTGHDTAQPGVPARRKDPTADEASAPPPSCIYALVGPKTGPPAPTETRNTAQLER